MRGTLMKKFILMFIIPLLLLTNGCAEKRQAKKPVKPEHREVFRGVIDPSGEKLQAGVRGGRFIRADIQEIDTFNPVITRSRAVQAVLNLVFESLLSIHPVTRKIQGCIGKGYSIGDNGHTIVIPLNDVKFSDGTPCTADDVLFTFEEIYLNPDVDAKKKDALTIRDSLVTIEKTDDHTVQFHLPVPYRPFLHTLTEMPILPKHILEPYIEKNGISAFNREWGIPKNGTLGIVGTGPYQIQKVQPGESFSLERNPYYTRREGSLYLEGMPYLDEIVELLNIDTETKLLKFQIGELDFYDVKDTDIASGDFEVLLQNREEGNYLLYTGGETLESNHFMSFNQKEEIVDPEKLQIFRNREFREAVSSLIDRKKIIDEVYDGCAYIDASPSRSVSPFYTHLPADEYSIEKARELLSQTTLRDSDGDGYLDLPSGKPFSFTILTNEDNPLRVKMGRIITESLGKAGISAQLKPADYDLIVTKLLDTFDWDAVILGLEGSIEPNDASWIWESKGALHLWDPYRENPASEWEARINELFALGRTTWDFERARGYYDEFQRIVAEQLPIIAIVVPAQLYGFRKGLGNVIPRAVNYNALSLMPYIYNKKKR